jgi:hypothetical protein
MSGDLLFVNAKSWQDVDISQMNLSFSPPPPCRLAKIVATNEWQPDICYTVDIAEETNGKISLLEINSFSCAGFYDCDISSIVSSASKAAINEWKEYF